MSAFRLPRRAPRMTRERGQAMLLTVLLLATGVGAAVYNFVAPAKQATQRDRITSAALAQARDALIGRAAADDNRPGSLPCPDLITNIAGTNVPNDGVADLLVGNECPSYVGRLPWRTLGLPDLRDGNGERLWYALSRSFRDDDSAQPINSDTAGQLTITGGASAVIAIVFSPGSVVGAQTRDSANQNNVASYLEGGNETGSATGIFTFGQETNIFNDKLLAITRETLFPVVEMRVARELRLSLRQYYNVNHYYPYAAPFPNNVSTPNTYRGYVPTSASGCIPPGMADVAPYLPGYAAAPPGWFVTNEWYKFMVYAVAPRCTPKINVSFGGPYPSPPACALSCTAGPSYFCSVPNPPLDTTAAVVDCNNTAAGSFLSVTGVSSTIESIVMPASYRLGAQPARPCTAIGDCLEAVGASTENIDTPDNYQYAKPARSATNNDNLVIVRP